MTSVTEVRSLHDAKLLCLQQDFVVARVDLHVIMLSLSESDAQELRDYFDAHNGKLIGELGE